MCSVSSTLFVKTAVCGYHVYRTIWEPHVGKKFIVIQKSGNSHNGYAMAVSCRDEDPGAIVEHLPLLHKALDSLGTHKALGPLNGVLVK